MIDVDAIHAAVSSPLDIAMGLGLKVDRGARQHRCRVLCPWHNEKKPSCTVSMKDGRIFAHCFSCHAGADLFGLVAVVHGLDTRTDFRRVAELTADLVGVRLDSEKPFTPRRGPGSSVLLSIDVENAALDWLAGKPVHTTRALELANQDQLNEAFDLLRIADGMERDEDRVANADLNAMADDVLAKIAAREALECM